jgi:hypothetical protein
MLDKEELSFYSASSIQHHFVSNNGTCFLFTQKFKAEFCYIFSAALNFVLLAMGFLAISFSVGRTTFFVKERKTFF